MNKIFLLILLVGTVCGCEKTNVEVLDVEQEGIPIVLSSGVSVSTAEAGTRAATNFPNNGNIGIVAATELNSDIGQTNWSLYEDINNRQAVATSVDANGVYSFQWADNTPRYWPFDGSALYFMAYSPVADGTNNNYRIDEKNSSISMDLHSNIPDVMYASNNTANMPHSKTTGVVNLGEFRHALSQLTIKVNAAAGLPPKITVSRLAVSTSYGTADLFLPEGDNGLKPLKGATYEAVLLDGSTGLASTISRTLLLFPGTEDETKISIAIYDTEIGNYFTGNYMLSVFQSDKLGQPILLEPGKNTELRITVNIADLQNPSAPIGLKGRITDWDYKGHFNIGIN